MKDAKHYLEKHTEYVKDCIHTTSEESEGIRSRTSSEVSSESVKEFKEEPAEESESSADETDDDLDEKPVSEFYKCIYIISMHKDYFYAMFMVPM